MLIKYDLAWDLYITTDSQAAQAQKDGGKNTEVCHEEAGPGPGTERFLDGYFQIVLYTA